MTISELRALIADLPGDLPVVVYYDCETRPHTEIEADVMPGQDEVAEGFRWFHPEVRSFAFSG